DGGGRTVGSGGRHDETVRKADFDALTEGCDFVFDPPVRMPDQPAPLPAGMAREERCGPDLIDVVTAPWLTADDTPGALDGVGIADSVASMADSEHGPSVG